MSPPPVSATPAALEWIQRLKLRHGPLMFHQSGGCCDGSSPMCYPLGEFRVGPRDVLMGEIDGCPYYIDADQHERWKHTRLTIDVVPGRGAGFSVEAPEGIRFLIRSDLCDVPLVRWLRCAAALRCFGGCGLRFALIDSTRGCALR